MLLLADMIESIESDKPTYLQYLIIPGNYNESFEIKDEIEKILNRFMNKKFYFIPFDIDYKDVVTIDDKTESSNIAFNAKTGKFVTKSIDFSTESIVRILNEGSKGKNI